MDSTTIFFNENWPKTHQIGLQQRSVEVTINDTKSLLNFIISPSWFKVTNGDIKMDSMTIS